MLINRLTDNVEQDIVLDFSAVTQVTCMTLCQLTKMQKMLKCSGHQLGFCNVAVITMEIFEANGFDTVFEHLDIAGDDQVSPYNKNKENSSEPQQDQPGQMKERRRLSRMCIPRPDVGVQLWRRPQASDSGTDLPKQYVQGYLIDIAEAGTRIAIKNLDQLALKEQELIKVLLPVTPFEDPLLLDAEIMAVVPATPETPASICVMFLGSKANPQWQDSLQELLNSLAEYYEAVTPASA
jgi:anti-anti-sigma regulatory factor